MYLSNCPYSLNGLRLKYLDLALQQSILHLQILHSLLHLHILRCFNLNDAHLLLFLHGFTLSRDQLLDIDLRVPVELHKHRVVLGRDLKFLRKQQIVKFLNQPILSFQLRMNGLSLVFKSF